MRCKLYCHSVRSQDDGRTLAYLSSNKEYDLEANRQETEMTNLAPFEAYDIDEALRGGFWYEVTFKRINEKE